MANATLLAEREENIPLDVLPADEPSPAAATGETTLELVELLLKDPGRLQQLNRDPRRQGELVPRFLLIALAGYLIYSCMMVLIINMAPTAAATGFELLPLPPRWHDGSALSLPLAYTLSVVLASCVCLPSFYFYSLLAGVRITWLQIVGLAHEGDRVQHSDPAGPGADLCRIDDGANHLRLSVRLVALVGGGWPGPAVRRRFLGAVGDSSRNRRPGGGNATGMAVPARMPVTPVDAGVGSGLHSGLAGDDLSSVGVLWRGSGGVLSARTVPETACRQRRLAVSLGRCCCCT